PEGPTAIAGLAMSLSALERLDEATTLMQRLPPGSPARHALALRLLLQADPAAALPLEISARVDQLAESPDVVSPDHRLLLWLAWMADYRHGQHARAERALRKLVGVQPGSLLAIDQLDPAAALILLWRHTGHADVE